MGSFGRAAVSRTAWSPEISIVDARFRPSGASRRRPADRTPVSSCWIHVAPDGAAGFGLRVFRRLMGKNADPDSKAINVLIWRARYVAAGADAGCGPSVARARF